MLANYLPLINDPEAPEIVLQLRRDLDERLMDLHAKALELLAREPDTAAETVHVPYESFGLHVIAVFHQPSDQFTQLIARSAKEQGVERPSFTISLFLTRTMQ